MGKGRPVVARASRLGGSALRTIGQAGRRRGPVGRQASTSGRAVGPRRHLAAGVSPSIVGLVALALAAGAMASPASAAPALSTPDTTVSGPQTIPIAGTGFKASTKVRIVGSGSIATGNGQWVRSDGNGSFSVDFAFTGSAPGSYPLDAQTSTGGAWTTQAELVVTVAAGAATASPTPTATPIPTPTATATPTPTASATPTATPTSGIEPSGQAMPVGDITVRGQYWKQVFTDDFPTDVPLGSFPSAVSSTWQAYPDGWPDTTHNGTYACSKVCSIAGGVLDLHLHTEGGIHYVAAPVPRIPGSDSSTWGDNLYARYVIRFRADSLPGYKTAWLLWPESGLWPQDGEIDFPEGDLDGTIKAFMHHQGATSGSQQDAYTTSATYPTWHTAVIEWLPSRVSFYLDGTLVGESTAYIPSTPMHWVIQTETSTDEPAPADTTAGHVQIDWVAVYRPG